MRCNFLCIITEVVVSEVVIQAPRRGEIPRVQIADLCEGCISLSNAEGFGERLFHFSYIIGID